MSDFGRGYATCLRQFLNHKNRLGEIIELYGKLDLDEERAAKLWANGASDHLYELVRPRRSISASEWKRAKRLQSRAIDIGHDFHQTSVSSAEEANALLDEAGDLLAVLEQRGYETATLEAAMATDQALGIRPDAGTWACKEDLLREVVTQ